MFSTQQHKTETHLGNLCPQTAVPEAEGEEDNPAPPTSGLEVCLATTSPKYRHREVK